MAAIPQMCEDCGRVNQSRPLIRVTDSENITVNGGRFSGGCPYCGGIPRPLDGTYSVRGDLIEVLSAPDWSMSGLRRLQRSLEQAESLRGRPREAISLVSRVSGRVGAVLRRAHEINESDEVAGFKAIC